MTIALLVALLVSGGATIAAEQALPGDLLYPVKVEVNESVRSAIAISGEAQATWDARRAERRLEEAEELAAEGRLDQETRTELEARLDESIRSFESQQAKLEAKEKHALAQEIEEDLETTLRAHNAVLAAITTGDQQEIDRLVSAIQAEVDTALTAEAQVATGTEAELRAAAEGKMGAAQNKLAEVKSYLERKSASVDAQVSAYARAKVAQAEGLMAQGKAQIEAKAYADAFATFKEASRIAQEAKILLATSNTVGAEASLAAGTLLEMDDDTEDAEEELEDGEEEDGETESQDGEESADDSASVEVETETEIQTGGGSAGTRENTRGSVRVDLGL